jgi:hypothetical protein
MQGCSDDSSPPRDDTKGDDTTGGDTTGPDTPELLCDRLEAAIEADDSGAVNGTLTAMSAEGPDLDNPETWDRPDSKTWLLATMVLGAFDRSDQASFNAFLDELRAECAGTTPESSPLAEFARTGFCKNFLPLSAAVIDLSAFMGEDPEATFEDARLFIDVVGGVLQDAKTLLTFDAFRFEVIGDHAMRQAATDLASATDGVITASNSAALVEAVQKMTSSEVQPAYCEGVIDDFTRGYMDAWFGRARASRTGEYKQGYEQGLAEGWRDDIPG